MGRGFWGFRIFFVVGDCRVERLEGLGFMIMRMLIMVMTTVLMILVRCDDYDDGGGDDGNPKP